MCRMYVKRVVVDCIPASCQDCVFVTTNVNHHFRPGEGYMNDDFFCGILDRPDSAVTVTSYAIIDPTPPVFHNRPIFCPLAFEE